MKRIELPTTNNFVILVLIFSGFALLYLGNSTKQNVTNFSVDDRSVTIIDLSARQNDFNLYLVLGILLFAIGIVLTLKNYFVKNSRNTLKGRLTDQEKKVVSFIQQGKTNKEIAIELAISHSTVKTHVNNIYKKLGIHTRKELMKST